MGLKDRLAVWFGGEHRDQWPQITIDEYAQLLSFSGNTYLTGGLNYSQTIRGHEEEVDYSFPGLVMQAYKANGVVFACMLARQQLFTEARFQFQQMRGGRPGTLFGSAALDILEHPWPNGVTGDLLARAIQDVDLGGNFFAVRQGNALRRMRPDWVTIVLGSPNDPEVEAGDVEAEVLGYIYHPGGRAGREPVAFLREQVAHFAPIPDPTAAYRGMSWLQPIVREIFADKAMTDHKQQYLINGATPNMVVSLDKDMAAAQSPAAFKEWIELFQKVNPTGAWDKFKTMYLAGGTKMDVVGGTLQQIDYRAVQGAGEVRIAIAAGVPASIIGLSEGLQGAALNAGNYESAKRRFTDLTMRPLWRNFAASMETVCPPPPGARLWYDDRDIQALAEDKKDLATVHQLNATTIRTYVDSGFTAESAIKAVEAGDPTLLKHTGLFSVQLQAPGSTKMPGGEVPGETPVGPGTAPEKAVVSPVPPTKQLASGRSEEMLMALLASRQLPPQVTFEQGAIQNNIQPPAVHVDATTTIEAGAITAPPVHIEPTQVTIAEGAFRSETTVEPPVVNIEEGAVRLVQKVPMRTVIDRDADGKVTGSHEERIE